MKNHSAQFAKLEGYRKGNDDVENVAKHQSSIDHMPINRKINVCPPFWKNGIPFFQDGYIKSNENSAYSNIRVCPPFWKNGIPFFQDGKTEN
jgi:hypothetical protein